MESYPLVISHILAEFHPERATYTTLHNHFSVMDYPNLLKHLLLGLKTCFLLTQSTLLFGETSPLKVSQRFLLFSLYLSSFNSKNIKLTKMDITRFAMKLHIIRAIFGKRSLHCDYALPLNDFQ